MPFKPTTPEAGTDGSLSLRPTWYKKQVQGQSHLGSNGKHLNQKSGEDVNEQRNHVLAQANSGNFCHEVLDLGLRREERAYRICRLD